MGRPFLTPFREGKRGKRIDKRQKERYTEYNSLKYKIFEIEIKRKKERKKHGRTENRKNYRNRKLCS